MAIRWSCVACLAIWSLCVCRCISASSASNAVGDGLVPDEVGNTQEEAVITKFQVIHPTDGDIETTPLVFRVNIEMENVERFKVRYEDKMLCVELDATWTECSTLAHPQIVFDELPAGNYSARSYITDARGVTRYHETPDITLVVLTKEDFDAYSTAMLELNSDNAAVRKWGGVLHWARQRRVLEQFSMLENVDITSKDDEILLIVGVKTAVLENFALRQAIRETWASKSALPQDVKVFFVACIPNLTSIQSANERQEIEKAIDMEKQTYGDLLTNELRCQDSYNELPSKVKEFLRYATKNFPQAPFIMITDDDMYLRADRLTDSLRNESRTQRLYIGQVWDTLLGRSQAPIRDTTGRYYISEESYPLHSYPSFGLGSHYLLSSDCARFIAKNSGRLRGLDAMDDISVALWLLTIQVHVEHTPAFSSLRIRDCRNGLLSVADLSPFGIRSIHANLVEKRELCCGFDRVAWLKRDHIGEGGYTLYWDIMTYVNDLNTSKHLQVTSVVSVLGGTANITVSYYPSAETLLSYTQRICAQLHVLTEKAKSSPLICRSVARELRTRLQQNLQLIKAGDINPAHVELWRHNLFVADLEASPLIIAYSNHADFVSIVLECLFVSVYEDRKRPILVMPEWVLYKHYETAPDVFVFSIVDVDCNPVTKPTCQQAIAECINEYYLPDEEAHSTAIMMIAGEPTDTQGLDERVILLSTVSNVARGKHAHISVASTSFGERLEHQPTLLLSPATQPHKHQERRFCAYLYARCDRPQREYMFNILNAMESVDALGICAGSSRPPDLSYLPSRFSTWYNDNAVTIFQNYKFVIAFENSGVPGYVTEKLVNPFLAGSIPIYLGNSTTVSELFNPDSFIDCGRFEKLRDCALYVMKVHKAPEVYEIMRREPPIRNITAFNEAFSWHPSVPSRALADKIARLIHA